MGSSILPGEGETIQLTDNLQARSFIYGYFADNV